MTSRTTDRTHTLPDCRPFRAHGEINTAAIRSNILRNRLIAVGNAVWTLATVLALVLTVVYFLL